MAIRLAALARFRPQRAEPPRADGPSRPHRHDGPSRPHRHDGPSRPHRHDGPSRSGRADGSFWSGRRGGVGLVERRVEVRKLAALAGIGVVLLAGGCGNPGGVDGELMNGWAAMGVPTGFTPKAQTCHLANFSVSGARSAYEVVDCGIKHRTETVFVGTYPGPVAEAGKPPEAGSAGAKAAYRDCDARTTEFVGGRWRTARLWIGVTNPTQEAWSGGARWYRCEVLESSSVEDDGGLVQRIGSLQNALAQSSSPLRLTCYAIILDQAGKIDKMPAATCSSQHNAEFAGVWDADADAAYPASTAAWDGFHKGCRGVIADYVKVPDDADLQYRAGVVSLPGGEDVWAMGDRGVRCYLWVDTTPLTSSLKGKGTKALPVQYQ